jgi:hypothetical protein
MNPVGPPEKVSEARMTNNRIWLSAQPEHFGRLHQQTQAEQSRKKDKKNPPAASRGLSPVHPVQ